MNANDDMNEMGLNVRDETQERADEFDAEAFDIAMEIVMSLSHNAKLLSMKYYSQREDDRAIEYAHDLVYENVLPLLQRLRNV